MRKRYSKTPDHVVVENTSTVPINIGLISLVSIKTTRVCILLYKSVNRLVFRLYKYFISYWY